MFRLAGTAVEVLKGGGSGGSLRKLPLRHWQRRTLSKVPVRGVLRRLMTWSPALSCLDDEALVAAQSGPPLACKTHAEQA